MNKYIKRFLKTDTNYIPLKTKPITLDEAIGQAIQKLDALNKKTTETSIQAKPLITSPTQLQVPAPQIAPVPALAPNPTLPQAQQPQQPLPTNQVAIDPEALSKLQQQNDEILKAQDELGTQTTELAKAQAEMAQNNPNAPQSENGRIGQGNFSGTTSVGQNPAPAPKSQTPNNTVQPVPQVPSQQQLPPTTLPLPKKPTMGIKAKQKQSTPGQTVAESTEPVIDAETLALVNPFKMEKKSIKKKVKPSTQPSAQEQVPTHEEPSALPLEAVKLLSDPIDFDHLEQLLKSIIDGADLNDVMGDNVVIQVPKSVQKAKITVDIEKALDLYGGEDKIASELLKDGPIKPVSSTVMQQLKGESPRMSDAQAEINAPKEILTPEDDPDGLSVAGLQDDVAFKFF